MKKLTLVLVALLLALTCVFVACGKKNNDTPVDNDPKPVDNDPTPVVEPTVAKEDLVKIAEALKDAYVENYVDLYSPVVVSAIDAEKSAALLKINSASSKEEAQKIADDFIAFLKAQKTTVDELKALVEKIGDVALADEDAVKEAKSYKTALENAFAGTNAAKKAALDAFAADTELQKTIVAMGNRIAQLKLAKAVANLEKDEKIDTEYTALALVADTDTNGKADANGINVEIAALNEKFTEAEKEFDLSDFDEYGKLLDAVAKFAKAYELVEGTDAYAEIIDTKTLAAEQTILDGVAEKDKVLVAMMKVIDASKALEEKAEAARYKVYCFVDKTATAPVAEYETEEDALKAGVKEANIVKAEKATSKKTANWSAKTATLKLSLKADVEAAVAVKKELFKFYNETELAVRYKYGDSSTEPVKAAVKLIGDIEGAYTESVKAARASYPALFDAQYVDVDPTSAENKKAATIGSYVVEGTFNKQNVSTNQSALSTAIDNAVKTFKTLNAAGKPIVDGSGLALTGKDDATYTPDGTYYYDLNADGKPVIHFTAWTYSYKLGKAALAVTDEFVPEKVLKKSGTLAQAQAALLWLEKYIGEDLAESYDFTEYKAYDAAFDGVVLTLADRDVTEVATAGVAQINGKAVEVAKSAALAVKVLNPLTVAKALIAEQEKIEAAEKAAIEELQAAVLAIFKAGDANAITAARKLYNGIADGSYLDEKLYGDAEADLCPNVDLTKVTVELKPESAKGKGDDVTLVIDDGASNGVLVKAQAVLAAAANLDSASTSVKVDATTQTLAEWAKAVADAEEKVAKNDEYLEAFNAYVARAKEILDAAKIGEDAKLIIVDTDTKNVTQKAAQAQYNNALQLNTIFTDKDTFDVAYGSSDYLGAKDKDDIKKFIEKFQPADAEIDADAMATYIAAITISTDGEQLAEAVEAAKKDLADAIAAFDKLEGLTAAKAYNDKTGDESDIDAVITAINALITYTKDKKDKATVDYINLKVAETIGEKTVAFDLLTDAYVGKLLATAYAPIGKILEAAKDATASSGLRAKDVLDTIAGEKWENSVTNLVEAEEVTIGTVASIKDAAKALEDYKLVTANYKLDTCLALVNGGLTTPITLADLKGVAGIN